MTLRVVVADDQALVRVGFCGIIAATPQEIPVLQAPSGPPIPEVTGTALPMA